ncbi:MAG: FtsW/RodA/SpoVE family cell cycle protein, partial [Candidatus Fermentibacteria bacterium]
MININPPGARNVMIASAVLLLILGTLAVFTASSFKSLMLTNSDSSTIFLLPHIKKVLIGIAAGVIAWMIPPGKLKKTAPVLYVLSLVMLIVLLLLKGTHWAPVINGSARWLVLFGGFRIMPSEIARIAYVILAASLVSEGVIRARTGTGVVWLALLGIIPA